MLSNLGTSPGFGAQATSPERAIRAGGLGRTWKSGTYLGKCWRDDSAPDLPPPAVWSHWSSPSCPRLRAAEPALSSCSSRLTEPVCPRVPPALFRTRSRWEAAGHRLSTISIGLPSCSQVFDYKWVSRVLKTLVQTKLSCNSRIPYTQILIYPPRCYNGILKRRERDMRNLKQQTDCTAAVSHWQLNAFSHTHTPQTKSTCSEQLMFLLVVHTPPFPLSPTHIECFCLNSCDKWK